MSKYVFSNLTTDQDYTIYREGQRAGEPAVVETEILIKGGHGVADDRIITPKGVCTTVSDEVCEALKKCPMFQRHEAKGYITVEGKKHDAEKVSENLEPKDGGAPLVNNDFKENQQPTTGAATA